MPLAESDLQRAVVMWCRIRPETQSIFAVPNGGKRDAKEAQNLKHQGVVAGIPDLFLPVMRGGYGGLFLELKSPTGKGRVSPEQTAKIAELREAGYMVLLSSSFDEVKATISNYLAL